MGLPEPIWRNDPLLPAFAQALTGLRKDKKLEMLRHYMKLLHLRIRAKELEGIGRDAIPQAERIRFYRKNASKMARIIGLSLRREHGMLADWSKDPTLFQLTKSLSRARPLKKEKILKIYLYVFQLLIQGQRIQGQTHETMATTKELQTLKEKARIMERKIGLIA